MSPSTPTEENSASSSKQQIDFRGRVVDPDAWISLVSGCHYLPESQMITLCNM